MSTDIAAVATETHDASIAAPAAGDPRTSASVRTPMTSLASRTKWGWKRIREVWGQPAPVATETPVAASADDTTDFLTIASHGFVLNDPVRLVLIGAAVAPAGLAAGTIYFARDIAADTFGLAATSGGALIDITDAGSGTFYLVRVDDPELYLPTVSTVVFGKLSAILARFGLLASANTWTAANTWTTTETHSGNETHSGQVVFSGTLTSFTTASLRATTAGYTIERTGALADATPTTFTGTDQDYFYVENVSANSTYTVTNPTIEGQSFTLTRLVVGSGFAALFVREDASNLVNLPNTGVAWAKIVAHNDDGAALAWHCVAWGGAATLMS